MKLRCEGAGRYRISWEDPREFVACYTREILSGALFLAGAAEELAEGEECAVRLEHPGGQGALLLPGEVEQIQRSAPKGIRVRLAPLPAELRAALEACVTELLRGGQPAPWPQAGDPDAGAESGAREDEEPAGAMPRSSAGDRALLMQEEATGTALRGRAVQVQLQELSLPEKIQLAIRGGKATRAALLRDPQPAIQAALVKNPRITSTEVAEIARNPASGAEAIQLIAANPQLMADRAICLHVVSHPKTDPQLAQKHLARLAVPQLRQLAKLLQGFGQLAYYGDDGVMLRIGYDAEANVARGRALRQRDGRP